MPAEELKRPDEAAMFRILARHPYSPEGVILRLAWQEGLSRKLLEAHTSAGLTPPNLKDVLEELGVSSKEAAPVLRLLCEQKKLVRVKDGLYYGNEAVEEILDKVRLWFSDHEDLDVGGLKEILDLSRKYLIALLEFMDREKITVRVGDARQYRGR